MSTPRLVIKEALQAKILKEGDGWIDMLEDRNKTSHIDDEEEANVIYRKIKENHAGLLKDLEGALKDWVRSCLIQ